MTDEASVWKDRLSPWQLLESAIRDKADPADPGDLALATEALARGADINARTPSGWTALLFAVAEDDPAMVELLFAHGAVADGAAVFAAAEANTPRVLKLLIAHGCPIEHDVHGDTPVVIAARNGHADVVAQLVAAGANVDHRDDSGRSARDYLDKAPS